METNDIKKYLFSEMPELRNYPPLMNSLVTFLTETDKIVTRLNEHSTSKKIVIEILVEDINPQNPTPDAPH